jgi:hypothetical protein
MGGEIVNAIRRPSLTLLREREHERRTHSLYMGLDDEERIAELDEGGAECFHLNCTGPGRSRASERGRGHLLSRGAATELQTLGFAPTPAPRAISPETQHALLRAFAGQVVEWLY